MFNTDSNTNYYKYNSKEVNKQGFIIIYIIIIIATVLVKLLL